MSMDLDRVPIEVLAYIGNMIPRRTFVTKGIQQYFLYNWISFMCTCKRFNQAGKRAYHTNTQNRTFHHACIIGAHPIVKELLAEQKVNLKDIDNSFWSACRLGHVEIVRLILAEPNFNPSQKIFRLGSHPSIPMITSSAFWDAVLYRRAAVVQELLQDPRADSSLQNQLTLSTATQVYGNPRVVSILLNDNRTIIDSDKSFTNAIGLGDIKIVRMLLDSGKLVVDSEFIKEYIKEVVKKRKIGTAAVLQELQKDSRFEDCFK